MDVFLRFKRRSIEMLAQRTQNLNVLAAYTRKSASCETVNASRELVSSWTRISSENLQKRNVLKSLNLLACTATNFRLSSGGDSVNGFYGIEYISHYMVDISVFGNCRSGEHVIGKNGEK